MKPPTLTAHDELTAAQIKRIWGLGFAAGLKNGVSVDDDDRPYIAEIERLQEKSEADLSLISLQSQTIQRLKGDVFVMRIIAVILIVAVLILLVIVHAQAKDGPELIIQPTAAEESGRI